MSGGGGKPGGRAEELSALPSAPGQPVAGQHPLPLPIAQPISCSRPLSPSLSLEVEEVEQTTAQSKAKPTAVQSIEDVMLIVFALRPTLVDDSPSSPQFTEESSTSKVV